MKKAIVYYSMTGNTDYVAKYMADKLNADLIRLVPKKEYPNKGLKKFLWGGKSAVMGETPELESYEFDSAQYDCVILGTPVWASSFAPPMRTFIRDNQDKLTGKKIAAFLCYMGAGKDKAIEKLKDSLKMRDLKAELALIDPKEKQTEENRKLIDEFCVLIQSC